MKEKTKWVHESQRNPVTMQSSVEGCVLDRTNKGPEFNSHHRGNLQALREILGRESGQRLLSTECYFSFKLSDAVGGFGGYGPHFEKQVSPLLILFCLFASSLYYKQEHEY